MVSVDAATDISLCIVGKDHNRLRAVDHAVIADRFDHHHEDVAVAVEPQPAANRMWTLRVCYPKITNTFWGPYLHLWD
jgi:hypothetical protein